MDLKKIWNNKKQILEGIKNSLFKQEHIEEVARERQKICAVCQQIDLLGEKCEVPGTHPCCGNCGCSLKFKLRSLSSACPESKWVAFVSEEVEDQIKKQINNDINNQNGNKV